MSNSRRRQARAATGLAIGVAMTLVLGACSSSGSTSGTSTSAAGSTSSAAGGSSPAATSSLPKTLVFSPLSLAPPALKGLSVGVKGYAGSKGWKVVVQDPNFSATTQTQQLNTVLSSGQTGAAWVIANDPKSMGDIIKLAQSKGIPILVNGKPDEYGFSGAQPGITFDYIDYAAGGKALGEQLGKCITSKLGGNADVLFSQSAPGQAGKAEFEAAALAGLKATAPNANVVQNLVVTSRSAGQTAIGNALQGHPKLAAVMASTDEGSLGALGAFGAAGKNLKCVTDFGGNDEVLKDVQAGTIYASVALQFQADMAQSFDTLVKMQSNPKAAGLVLTVPQKIITKG